MKQYYFQIEIKQKYGTKMKTIIIISSWFIHADPTLMVVLQRYSKQWQKLKWTLLEYEWFLSFAGIHDPRAAGSYHLVAPTTSGKIFTWRYSE